MTRSQPLEIGTLLHSRPAPSSNATSIKLRWHVTGHQLQMVSFEVVVHPYSGEAGAIGAAIVSLDWWEKGGKSQFRGFDVIETLTYNTTTSKETICNWCPVTCQRSFIDVALIAAPGREWSKVPISKGWERVIVNNSCPKGLVEDVNEMKVIKAGIEKNKNAFPNVADMVRKEAFRRNAVSV